MKPISSPFSQINRIAALAAGLFFALATAWQARAQPSLISAQPGDGATQVPLTASVVFIFDTPMEPLLAIHATDTAPFAAGSILWTGNINPGSFQNTWNAENTILTCDYTGNLPPGAVITWKINPSNALIKLGAEEDQFPANPASGTFTTVGEACDPDGIPDAYGTVGLFKSVTYLQTSAAAPVLKSDELPGLSVIVLSPDVNAVTGASFTKPGSATQITITNLLGFGFINAEEFTTQAPLDAAYPNGTYSFTLNRATPPTPTVFSMPMPAASSYPPIPQIINFQLGQAIDPAQAFVFSFNGFTGSTGADFIQLTIADSLGNTVLSAPDLCLPLVLLRTATSFTIPANTLQAGKTYTARLSYSRSFYSSTTSPPSFASNGALTRQTVFALATTGGVVVPPPQISGAGFQGGFFGFTAGNLVAGTTYNVEYSTTLLPNSWNLIQPITLPSGTSTPIVDVTSNPTTGQRFYRVIKP